MQNLIKYPPKTIAWDGTITADAYSEALSMADFDAIHVQVTQTGTLAGPVHLYGCNTEAGTYAPLTDSAGNTIVIGTFAGATLTVTKTVHGIVSPFVKFFYDDTSGSGTITSTVVRASTA